MKLSQKVGCAVLVLIALLSLSCSAMAVVKTLHFEDAKDHWAEEIIEALAEKEVVKGYRANRVWTHTALRRSVRGRRIL